MLTTALAPLFLSVLAAAQIYGPPPPPQTSLFSATSSAAAAAPPIASNIQQGPTVDVDVAPNGEFIFNPANITASNGTTVIFHFPKADSQAIPHSVTQSSFASPCTYLAASGNNPAGFDSGLQLAMQFSITIVDDTQPIWFHCKQVEHCGLGMVGSINAPTIGQNTFDNFRTAAFTIGSSEQTESDHGPVTGGFNAIATAPPVPIPSGSTSDSSVSNSTSSSMSNNTSNNTSDNTSGSSSSGATKVAASAFLAFLAAAFASVFA